MKEAEYYTKITKQNIPYFCKMMNLIEDGIAKAAESGYTKYDVSIEVLLNILGVKIEEDKLSSLRNLIIKEIKSKNFTYGFDNGQLIIYW